MRDLIILPSWLVVNPSPEPEVTEPFWSEWFSDEARSDEVCPCPARDPECDGNKCFGERVTELRGVDCQCAICLGGSY